MGGLRYTDPAFFYVFQMPACVSINQSLAIPQHADSLLSHCSQTFTLKLYLNYVQTYTKMLPFSTNLVRFQCRDISSVISSNIIYTGDFTKCLLEKNISGWKSFEPSLLKHSICYVTIYPSIFCTASTDPTQGHRKCPCVQCQ